MKRILVIRYGGFGDLIMAMSAFRTIRAHHPGDRITILTTRRFVGLTGCSPYFDDLLIDDRLKIWQLRQWSRFVRTLRDRRFDRVYDLQRNQRTGILYRILAFGRSIEWSGVARGSSHRVPDNRNARRHAVETLSEQLAAAGIPESLPPNIDWLCDNARRFGLPHRYALIVPGGAPHRSEKRAPAACFAGLGRYLLGRGVAPVLLGTSSERGQIEAICTECRGAIDLCERTSFGDIAELARGAIGAVGNDTGAMHLIAQAGCPCLVLFSGASDPAQTAPRGRCVHVLRSGSLTALRAEHAIAGWTGLVDAPAGPARAAVSAV